MEQWFVEVKRADFAGIAKRFHISPVTARILRNRDMTDEEEMALFLNGTREDLYDPFLLADMQKAVSLTRQYIKEGKKLRIIGDYDIDGICASYILQKGLACVMEEEAAESGTPPCAAAEDRLDVVVPHRIYDGYGLNDELIRRASADGVEVIITCDNGIAAAAQIAYAKELGIKVIVTDHHEVPYEETAAGRRYILPPAEAVVDPKREDCGYPFKGICGGAVAYKLVEALFSQMPAGDAKREAVLEECFAFAAFATVGDVMELKNENHIWVKYGLKSIAGCSNYGLQALIEQCGLKGKTISPYHVGFVLGPCFNASGRLDCADRVLELLQAKDRREAMGIAAELRELNEERQRLTEKGLEEAVRMVEEGLFRFPVLVVYLPSVHESLAGIIAGRLRERYHRPVFVLTKGQEGIKGSGRSIEGYHMFDEMTKVKELFTKYGGHKLAAGLSLPEGSAEEFRRRINEVCTLTKEDFVERVMIDVPMPMDHVTGELILQLQRLEPYGNGNPRPLFAQKDVLFVHPRILGKAGNVVKGILQSPGGRSFEGIYFTEGRTCLERLQRCGGRVDIVYTPTENTYRGETTVQIEIRHIKYAGEESV